VPPSPAEQKKRAAEWAARLEEKKRQKLEEASEQVAEPEVSEPVPEPTPTKRTRRTSVAPSDVTGDDLSIASGSNASVANAVKARRASMNVRELPLEPIREEKPKRRRQTIAAGGVLPDDDNMSVSSDMTSSTVNTDASVTNRRKSLRLLQGGNAITQPAIGAIARAVPQKPSALPVPTQHVQPPTQAVAIPPASEVPTATVNTINPAALHTSPIKPEPKISTPVRAPAQVSAPSPAPAPQMPPVKVEVPQIPQPPVVPAPVAVPSIPQQSSTAHEAPVPRKEEKHADPACEPLPVDECTADQLAVQTSLEQCFQGVGIAGVAVGLCVDYSLWLTVIFVFITVALLRRLGQAFSGNYSNSSEEESNPDEE
jgi:hypothetical protein